MIQTVVKRDGRIVYFNEQKISAAIRKEMLTTDEGENENLLYCVSSNQRFIVVPASLKEVERRALET